MVNGISSLHLSEHLSLVVKNCLKGALGSPSENHFTDVAITSYFYPLVFRNATGYPLFY